MALERLDDSAELKTLEVPIEIDTTIESRAGGRPGSHGYDESGAPWPRLMLEFAEHHKEDDNLADPPTDAVRKLKYVSMGRRAQASNLEVDVVLSQIDRHVRTAIQDQHADPQTNNTLFELLLPNEAKLELETLDNLHLLVDESTAWIPWEMITGRDTTGRSSRPLALRAGLLRQLKPRSLDAPRKVLRAVTDHDARHRGPTQPPAPSARRRPGGDARRRCARRSRVRRQPQVHLRRQRAAERRSGRRRARRVLPAALPDHPHRGARTLR